MSTDKPALKKLTYKLEGKDRELLSFAIDEIERATYFETRGEILRIIKRVADNETPEAVIKKLDYMINKPMPYFKDRDLD
jgi:hypothetical protein